MKRFSKVSRGDEIFIAHVDEKVEEPYIEKLWVPEILTSRELCAYEGWPEEIIDENESDDSLHIRFEEMSGNAFNGLITVSSKKSCVKFPSMTDENELTCVCTSRDEAARFVKSEIIRRFKKCKDAMSSINESLRHLLEAQKNLINPNN